MLIVRVKVGQAVGRQITLKSGQIKSVAEQVGFIEVADEVRKVRLPIDVQSGQAPYEPGLYVVSAGSFTVGKFNDLGVNQYDLHLVPLEQALADAAKLVPKVKAA